MPLSEKQTLILIGRVDSTTQWLPSRGQLAAFKCQNETLAWLQKDVL